MLWLVVFSIFAVFSLCPLASFATRYNLTAGGPSDGTFYVNAPVFVAGDSARNETTGSADTSTGVLNATATNKPLFKTDGIVNLGVLADLLNMVDSENVWNGVTENTNAPTYLTAKNFGKYGTQNGWTNDQKGNAQILVKLFENTTGTTNSANVASAQYWQAVYRSIRDENGTQNDVLTLYMARPYKNAIFNPRKNSTENGITYRWEGNYSQSYLRDKTVKPLYETLKSTYSVLDQYVVAPSQLASSSLNLGGWQSSAYQTSYNSSGALYNTNSGVGSSGYSDGSTDFGLENGMDGLSGKHSNWNGTVESTYDDKLWVPSGFEVLHTGYGQTATSQLQNTDRLYDEANDIIYLDSGKATAGINSSADTASHKNANRTGLWELNGYDRASNSYTWLRSGSSSIDGGNARYIFTHGKEANTAAVADLGVRVALHLNLGTLKSLLPKETKVDITATNNAKNSLLVLTIMDGDARIAEYSCISGAINATLALDLVTTYKILATRPFGSSLEVKLDEVLQSPTNFACYEIYTAAHASMNIKFTLTGDGSWKNCVVI